MNRCLALLLAVMFATLTVSSACVAAPAEWIDFTLRPERGDGGKIHASFDADERGRDRNSWSTGFRPSDLTGLDLAGFRGSGTRPLHFAVVREAGRLDCSGNGGGSRANGTCRNTADAGFAQMLPPHGNGRPNREQPFGQMALDARRSDSAAFRAGTILRLPMQLPLISWALRVRRSAPR